MPLCPNERKFHAHRPSAIRIVARTSTTTTTHKSQRPLLYTHTHHRHCACGEWERTPASHKHVDIAIWKISRNVYKVFTWTPADRRMNSAWYKHGSKVQTEERRASGCFCLENCTSRCVWCERTKERKKSVWRFLPSVVLLLLLLLFGICRRPFVVICCDFF